MQYVHITDPHLTMDENWNGFSWALEQAAAFEPAVVVITGDIACDVGTLPLYHRVRQLLDRSGLEFLLLPGNHDDRTLFEEAFGRRYHLDRQWPRLDRLVDAGGQEMVLIDTADDGVHPDTVAWFDAVLDSFAAGTRIGTHRRGIPVWIHHPLGDTDALIEVCRRYRDDLVIHLFCGHYHTDSVRKSENVVQYCTRSLWKHIDPLTMELRFRPDIEIGFRLITHDDDSINTVVITPPGEVS